MSKSKNNTIEPDSIIGQGYGADSIRIMELFIGPWNQVVNWSVEGMGGSFHFLQRVWTLVQESQNPAKQAIGEQTYEKELGKATHKAIKKVSQDVHELSFNTAIAALMEYTNDLYKLKAKDHFANRRAWNFAVEFLLQLLAPFAPHISEELWEQLGHKESIHVSQWPKYDEKYLVQDTITVVIQVNGKLRGDIRVAADATEASVVEAAKVNGKVASYLKDQAIHKTIYVPGKLVNFVI